MSGSKLSGNREQGQLRLLQPLDESHLRPDDFLLTLCSAELFPSEIHIAEYARLFAREKTRPACLGIGLPAQVGDLGVRQNT
jgi:hypothetical protein